MPHAWEFYDLETDRVNPLLVGKQGMILIKSETQETEAVSGGGWPDPEHNLAVHPGHLIMGVPFQFDENHTIFTARLQKTPM